MDMTALFTVALGLQEPWYVDKIEFKSIQQEAGYPPSLHPKISGPETVEHPRKSKKSRKINDLEYISGVIFTR